MRTVSLPCSLRFSFANSLGIQPVARNDFLHSFQHVPQDGATVIYRTYTRPFRFGAFTLLHLAVSAVVDGSPDASAHLEEQ